MMEQSPSISTFLRRIQRKRHSTYELGRVGSRGAKKRSEGSTCQSSTRRGSCREGYRNKMESNA